MKKGLVIFSVLVFCAMFARASITSVIAGKSKKADVSGLINFYETLGVDEKAEQARDWAFISLVKWLNAGKYSSSQILSSVPPLRYGFLKNTGLFEIEEGRSGILSDDEWFVLLPQDKKDEMSVLSSVLDKRRSSANRIPSKIYLFSYEFDAGLKKISLDYVKTLPGKEVFSPLYGYFEKEVKNFSDFAIWVSSADDITGALWGGSNIVLYGRKYPAGKGGALSANDVAAIYQAYFRDASPAKEQQRLREYNVFISKKYDEVLRMNKGLRYRISKGLITRKQIIEEIRKKIPYNPEGGDASVGFSLDPQRDFNGLAEDITKMAGGNLPPELPKEVLLNTAARIKSEQSLEPLLRLRRKLRSGDGRLKNPDDALRNMELKNSYQSARYDGKVKGTEPAMILFYTDLVAKLWALNFNNTAPVGKVAGFRTMSEIKVSKIYWDEFLKLSNTRLWFGLRQENFNIYGKKLLFSPVVTRVYAASSDPLFPGKESQPNSQSADFLGWWDAHYAAVADYENYYHKLNQIQKWACLFMVLNEEKNRSMDFLLTVPVDHSADFRAWYKNNTSIKIKTEIPFVDGKKYGKDTECLLLMSSGDYQLMDKYFFLSGGVSLASKKDILSKLGRGGKTTRIGAASKYPGKGTPSATGGTAAKETKQSGDKIVWALPAGRAAGFKGDLIEIPGVKTQAVFADTSGIMKLSYNFGGERLGTFSASEENGEIKLNWSGGEASLANELVEKLAKHIKFGPDGESFMSSLPYFESIIRSAEAGFYLLKPVNSGKWIYLTINAELKDKKNVYYVKAAGPSSDADVYKAEIISEEDAKKITGVKIK